MNIEVIADGVVRDENQNWVYYIDTERVNELDPKRCGKWMYMTADLEHAEKLVREAVVTGAVIEAKRSTAAHMALSRSGTGVCCFYLNGDDAKAHHRAIEFFAWGHNLVRRTKAGRLYNVSFKFDERREPANMAMTSTRRSVSQTSSTSTQASSSHR